MRSGESETTAATAAEMSVALSERSTGAPLCRWPPGSGRAAAGRRAAALRPPSRRARTSIPSRRTCTRRPRLRLLPQEAVLASLGCGNPTALATLAPGEIVLDLGSGGGIDVLLSAKRVGPTGKAYGLDMTDEMLELANENKAQGAAPPTSSF